MIKIVNVVGARPNFMKIAPLMAQYKKYSQIEPILVHTGQHYDKLMSELFFEQLEIPKPDINLGIGSGTHAQQTAEIMKAIEPVLISEKPDAIVVVGDVNSTIASGLVASKLGIKIIHVEAGLRSFDRSMPEEINRILTDTISDLLFCTEESGVDNLLREGVAKEKVHFVGHVMIDTLFKNTEKARASKIIENLKLEKVIDNGKFALMTLHRPSNVDNPETLERIIDGLAFIQNEIPILFPVHPRTLKNISSNGMENCINAIPNLHLMEPVGYLDFLKLMTNAHIVVTDSGGIQEETTALKIPCLTLRENTERPVTIRLGSNQLVGTDPEKIKKAYLKIKDKDSRDYSIPPLWDGHAAERIVEIIINSVVV